MTLLTRVRQRFESMSKPKAISLRPDLAGREHIYSSYAGGEPAIEDYVSYATVYGCYPWVKRAVTVIADNVASLPVRVVDANDKELPNHPLSLLLANVNDEDAPAQLWRAYVVNMLLAGETFYQFVPDGRGRPAEIWMRRPDQIGVLPDMTRLNYPTAALYQFTGEDNQTIDIPPDQMAHDKLYNPLAPWRGLAPIAAVREGITIDLFARAYRKLFFKSSARPDYAVIAPQGITQSERDRLLSDIVRKHGGVSQAHLPIILEQGVTDIKTLSFPAKDIEWLQQLEFNRDEVAAIFGVPDEIMGYGRDTYENFGTALEVLWTLTLLPFIRNRDTTLTRHFAKYGFGLLPGQRIDTDLSGVDVLQEDIAPKIDMATKLWAMGVPYNKLDEKFGFALGPVEGGDVGFVASGLMRADEPQADTGDAQPAAGGNQEGVDAAQHPQILGYHIEEGVVTHNEARGALGFPPLDESEDMANRKLRTQLELMTMARSAGIAAESAAELVGLDVEIEPPPPAMRQATPNGDNPGAQGVPDPPQDKPPADNAPQEPPAKYLLPDAAKEGAIRALKKLVQGVQDNHLRALRAGDGIDPNWDLSGWDVSELRRWLGERTDAVVQAIEGHVLSMTGDHDTVNAAYNALKSDESLAGLLEVATERPFFTRKAMVLRLDPEDDEAERTIRLALDRRATRSIHEAFSEMLDTLYPGDYDFEMAAIEAQRVHNEFMSNQALRDALSRALLDGVDLGVRVAISQFDNIGFGFDWTLTHTAARDWANQYTGQLIQGITDTTVQGVRQAVTRLIDNGEPLEQLIADLQPYFGRQRAGRVAVTETTRAYQQGSQQAWRDSGVVDEMEWQTVRDERVCVQCGPMQGKRLPLGGAGDLPPLHVNCRCFTRPVIKEPQKLWQASKLRASPPSSAN